MVISQTSRVKEQRIKPSVPIHCNTVITILLVYVYHLLLIYLHIYTSVYYFNATGKRPEVPDVTRKYQIYKHGILLLAGVYILSYFNIIHM